jgi:hypothetical protein
MPTVLTISNSDFLAEVLGDLPTGQHGWVCTHSADPGAAPPGVWAGRLYRGTAAQAALIDGSREQNTYFSTGILTATPNGEVVRRKDALVRLACLLVDDIDPGAILSCSWLIQTSPGKFQSGITLDAADPDVRDADLIDHVMHALAVRGRSNDRSGNACVRYGRLPAGLNLKARAAGHWRVALEVFSPGSTYSLADACESFGINLDSIRKAKSISQLTAGESRDSSGSQFGEIVAALMAPCDQRAYHDSITKLAAGLIAGGMFPANAVNLLYSVMDTVRPAGDNAETLRWEQRRAEIPRAVRSAEKFAPQERKPTSVNINLSLPGEPAAPSDLLPLDWMLLEDAEPEPPRWRVDYWLPERTTTLLSANGGVGKSNLALQLAASIAVGQSWFDLPTRQGKVLVISAEDEGRTVHFRMRNIAESMGIGLRDLHNRVTVYDLTAADCVLWRDGAATDRMAWLAETVTRHGADVVVLDNASDVFADNENDRACVRGFMRVLNLIAQRTGAAILLLAHVDKASVRGAAGQESASTYSGSTAWNNSARSRWAMVRVNNREVALRHEKSNLGPLQEPVALEFDPQAKVFRRFGLAVANVTAATVLRNRQREVVLKLIAASNARGVPVPVNPATGRNAYSVLCKEPDFPSDLDRGPFLAIVREMEADGLLVPTEYRTSGRHVSSRYVLSEAGKLRAGVA